MNPVAIIGGGPVGLVASILLSQRKIPHVLFERYPSTSIHPKACGLNQRTIEIFRQMGIESEILQHRAPPESVSRTAWYTSLGPSGREIVTRDAWGGGQYQVEYERVSPCPYVTLPQIRLESILQQRALELNPSGIHYNAEVVVVEEEHDRVILTVKYKDNPTPSRTEARYIIGADGGRGLTDSLAIKWEGELAIVDMVTAHFKAPISLHHPDPRVFITWFINPTMCGSIGTGYLYHLGPYVNPTAEAEEWVFACARSPDDPKRFDTYNMLARIKNSLQIPGLEIKLLSLSHWYVNAITADRYRSRKGTGRVFLVGDAAHRIPPWGALGLNSGVQDVHNLVWKLDLAVRSTSSRRFDALLDTYDLERRPIGQRVARTSLNNLRSHSAVMETALGINPEYSMAHNVRSMEAFFDSTSEEGARLRAAIDRAQKVLDNEFHALGAEVGWFYPTVDVEGEGLTSAPYHGGQVAADGELDCLYYHPSTIPGHHLPHAWLRRRRSDKQRVSTRDLLQNNKFLLLTRSRSSSWARLEENDLVQLEHISDVNADADADSNAADGGESLEDLDGTWAQLSGVEKSGAVLVRPDGIVAWRARTDRDVTPEAFECVLRRVLCSTEEERVDDDERAEGSVGWEPARL